MRQFLAVSLGLVLIVQNSAAWADSGSEESTFEQIGYGTGSVVGSAVYFPFKAAFCIVGGLSSGVAFIFARQTATKMANAACRGTWAITPDVVKGKERVQFIGAASGRAGSPGEPRSGQ